MSDVLQLAFALAFPAILLAMILWLAHLEDSLPARVRASGRKPDPEPILAIKVRARPSTLQPMGPPAPAVEQQPAVQRQPEPVAVPEPAAPAPNGTPVAPAANGTPVATVSVGPVVAGRRIPEQRRPEPAEQPAAPPVEQPAAQALEGSRSPDVSFGGSTNL